MMNFIKNNKGITVLTLSIAVIIVLIITGMLLYNATNNIQIKNYQYMKNDIEILREKVIEYYDQYGTAPVANSISNDILPDDLPIGINDTGDFYVLDLKALDGLSLNYGSDYEEINNGTKELDSESDVYIINKNSLNIFLLHGVVVDGATTYYTDYTVGDEENVNVYWVQGVKIPVEYTFPNGIVGKFDYIGGSKYSANNPITIKSISIDGTDNTDYTFTWIVVDGTINSIDDISRKNDSCTETSLNS